MAGETQGPSRDNTAIIYHRLREDILHGRLAAGSGLSQVQIAEDFGVSRGPVREALRLLQREGLIEAELNRRARVTPFSVEDLEQLYAMRILSEAFAVRVSVPHFTDADLEDLSYSLEEMERLTGGDVDAWEKPHLRFHAALLAYAGDRILHVIDQWFEHSERYRRIYIADEPSAWRVGASEHRSIFEACVNHHEVLAAELLARHLSRTALTILGLVAPEHEPSVVRTAVRAATGVEAPSPVASRRHPNGDRVS